jgi:S1-C subfamily serine protease
LKELFIVEIYYTPLDDDAVGHFRGMRQLSTLRIFGGEISQESGERLAADLPTTKVDLRRGGFLGIGVQGHPLGCIIINVQPRSAADEAGIEIGDVILSIGGKNVRSFEELTAEIAKYKPGEEIAMELFRGGDREPLKIKLGEWE